MLTLTKVVPILPMRPFNSSKQLLPSIHRFKILVVQALVDGVTEDIPIAEPKAAMAVLEVDVLHMAVAARQVDIAAAVVVVAVVEEADGAKAVTNIVKGEQI